jgi:Ca2+-binding RTX toxin-like protein
MASLINDLGGTAGFGEFWLPANDDGSTGFIDLTPIFGAQGINFFGLYYTGFYLNNNGSVTFSAASSSFTPSEITESTSNPIIAAYWADIDTRGGAVAPSPGGTSAGTNLLWYDLDPVSHTFTATWDDVGYYDGQTNKLNSFQLSIRQINAQGDFDITFRYENVDWTTGSASGGIDGLGGTPARAGYSAGNGVEYYELPQSSDQAALLALESASNVGAPGTFVFSVRNGVPTVGITVGDVAIDEGDGGDPLYLSIPVFLTEASTSTVTVNYTTANGSALAGQDYVAQSGILTFAAGVTQQNILVAVIGDSVVENSETFTVTLSDPSEGASILDGSGTGTIADDDASLSIAAASADAAEGNADTTVFTFTVTRTGGTDRPATATWTVSGEAVNGADFAGGTLPSDTVTLGIGETSKTIILHVAGDTQIEADEGFTVTLSAPGPGTSLGTASATGFIRNDDVEPASLSIAATSADKAEGSAGSAGSTPFTFTVTRTGDLTGASSAEWAVSGAAVTGIDFTGSVLPTGTVSFAAGEASKVIIIEVVGDSVVETDEAFSVTLSNPSVGTVIGTASASGLIRNDDASLSITATSADKPEGQSGSTAFTFTVTRTGDLSGASSAQWGVNGPAVDGADFAGSVLPTGTVSFAAGETSKVITIEVAGDSTVEPDEAFSVTLSSPSTGTNLGTASATGIIRNDDNSLSIAATSADKPEGDSGGTTFTFTVTRTGDLSGAASVDWAASGAAVFDADFIPFDSLLESSALISLTASEIGAFFPQIPTDADAFLPAFSLFGGAMPGGTLNFAAGESSKIIHVWALGEILAERDESFVITLSNASEGVSLDTASAVGTIRDDDGAGTIRSSVSLTLSPEFTKLILTDAANIDGIGNALDNQLFGNVGNNVLDGRAGADRMAGGLGNDTYIVDDAGDVVFEAADEGTDEVQSSVSFSLANGFIDNIILAGSDDIDATGNALDNHITGNAGNNRLYGGDGNDSFRFDTALSPLTNVDTIIDFNVSDDTILLANAIFTALTVTGTLAEAAFHIGPAAASTDHRIIYDNVSGDLFYDPNGDAAGGSILFAHLLPGLALTFQDFLVI